jgi:hypothetical protein
MMPTDRYSNRFEPLSDSYEEQRGKRVRRSTGGGSLHGHQVDTPVLQSFENLEELKKLPSDEKLNVILEGMSNMGLLKYRLDSIESTVYINCARNEVTDQRVKLLEYRSIDLEARAREQNVILTGVPEIARENCIDVVADVIKNNLDLDPKTFNIYDAYRLGRVFKPRAPHLSPTKPQHRFILVSLSHRVEAEILMRNAHKLKDTNIGLTRDLPREISDARKALWPKFKAERAIHGPKEVQIIYPAALKVKGKIIHDMFPDWYETLRGSRHTSVHKRVAETVKQNSDTMRQAFDTHYRDQHVEPCESETIEDICPDTDQNITATVPPCTEETQTRERPLISEPYVHTSCDKESKKASQNNGQPLLSDRLTNSRTDKNKSPRGKGPSFRKNVSASDGSNSTDVNRIKSSRYVNNNKGRTS